MITHFLSKKWGLGDSVDSDEDNRVDSQDQYPYFPNFPPVINMSAGYSNQCSNIKLWLNATNIDGKYNTTVSNGSSVSSWKDLSGENNHAIQSQASLQPVVVENALNGRTVVDFDGANDYLQSLLTDSFVSSGFTIFSVLKWDQPGGQKGGMLSLSLIHI